MKCEYCDNMVPKGATRCPSCGASVSVDVPETQIPVSVQKESERPVSETSPFIDPYVYVDKKSRVVYVILGIMFGEIGVHNFYAGYIGRGVAQLLITILSFGLLFWVSWLWAIIEICIVRQDGRSIPFG
jgi:hypothetical protein